MPDLVKIIHDFEDLEDTLIRLKRKVIQVPYKREEIEWDSLDLYLTDIRELADSLEDEFKKGIEYL